MPQMSDDGLNVAALSERRYCPPDFAHAQRAQADLKALVERNRANLDAERARQISVEIARVVESFAREIRVLPASTIWAVDARSARNKWTADYAKLTHGWVLEEDRQTDPAQYVLLSETLDVWLCDAHTLLLRTTPNEGFIGEFMVDGTKAPRLGRTRGNQGAAVRALAGLWTRPYESPDFRLRVVTERLTATARHYGLNWPTRPRGS